MPALIVYLLKVNAALCLFYLAYRFALRPLTFYYLNRFFLVFGIVFSTVYPFMDVSALFTHHEAIRRQLTVIVPNWQAVLPVAKQQVAPTNYWGWPIALFWIGAFLMAVKLVAQFVSLYRIRKISVTAQHWGHTYRSVDGDINPFSFWQDIYLNPGKHSDEELRSIIKHEQVHIKQWHTLDVILAELSTVFYWFNPGVWFIKQAVKENLEFITDREIIRSGIDEKAYQYSLVRVSALKPGASIVNNFNFLTIKKRIMMMNKKRSSRAQITKYVILLPLIILLALVFTVSKAELSKKSIVVLVNKLLPKAIALKETQLPVQTPLTPSLADTVKPKQLIIVRDTVKKVTVLQNDTLSTGKHYVVGYSKIDSLKNAKVYKLNMSMHVDTLTVVDGKPVKAFTTGKKVYSSNQYYMTDPKIVVVNSDNQPVNVNIQKINADDIDSIKILNNQSQSGKTYTGYRSVIVKIKPDVMVTGSTNNNVTASTVRISPKIDRVVINDINSNNDDMLTYVIDPKNIDKAEIEKMRKEFDKSGFNLKIHEDYSEDKLKGLSITINSKAKSSSASAAYTNSDMSKVDYMIKILADRSTGAVSVMAVKR
jgi:bla regulator protein blaR1